MIPFDRSHRRASTGNASLSVRILARIGVSWLGLLAPLVSWPLWSPGPSGRLSVGRPPGTLVSSFSDSLSLVRFQCCSAFSLSCFTIPCRSFPLYPLFFPCPFIWPGSLFPCPYPPFQPIFHLLSPVSCLLSPASCLYPPSWSFPLSPTLSSVDSYSSSQSSVTPFLGPAPLPALLLFRPCSSSSPALLAGILRPRRCHSHSHVVLSRLVLFLHYFQMVLGFPCDLLATSFLQSCSFDLVEP